MKLSNNALSLGSSAPPQASFQARSSGTGSAASADKSDMDQSTQPTGAAGQPGNSQGLNQSNGTDAGSSSGTDAAAGSNTSTGTAQPDLPQKPQGPSAQTRNAQAAQGRANPRATRAHSSSSATASAQATVTASDSDEAATDFGSVMASALGNAASAKSAAGAKSATTNSTDSPTPAADQQAAPTPTDAVAWIAQVLMPPGTAQATPSAAPGAASPTKIGTATIAKNSAAGAVTTDGSDASDDTSAPAGTANPAAVGKASSGAAGVIRGKADASAVAQLTDGTADATTSGLPPAATSPASDGQNPASGASTTLGNLSALADAQKLISGMSAGGGTDADSGATGMPATHAASTEGSTDAAQAAAGVQTAGFSRTEFSTQVPTISIQSSVNSAAFADDVSSKVTSLAQAGITQAQLQLNPSDLGPVQVHITMQSGQASVWFGATHSDTRTALEQSLPRLREMFAGAGMPLADSGVFREPPQQQQTQAQAQATAAAARSATTDLAAPTTVTQVSTSRLSLLDTYA